VSVTYVSYGPCFLCRRDCDETSVNVVWPDGAVRPVCSRCWEKVDDEPIDERLDMTEDRWDA